MPAAGFGMLMAMMLPYFITIVLDWIALLQRWIWLDDSLGPSASGLLH